VESCHGKDILHALGGIQEAPALVVEIPRKEKVGVGYGRINLLFPDGSITEIRLGVGVRKTAHAGHGAKIVIESTIF
jgi:hypothetical protein